MIPRSQARRFAPRRRLAPALAALAAAATAVATAAPPLPPEDALRAAVEAQPEVRAAEAGVREADAAARLTAMGPHEWTLSADLASRRTATEGRFGEWETALERGVRLPGKAALDRDIGRLEVERAAAAAQAARRAAHAAILEDWFTCLRAHAHARLAGEDAETTARIGDTVARRHGAGDAATLELALARADAATSAAEAASARSAAQGAARRLASRLTEGSCSVTEWDEPDTTTAVGAGDTPPDPALRVQELAAERAAKVAARTGLDRWPDPTLGVRYGSERDGEERVGGLSISVPIGTPRRSAESARARAAADVAAAELDAARAEQARERLGLALERARAGAAWQPLAQAAREQDEAARLALRAWELGELPLAEALRQRRAALGARRAERDAALDAWRAAALYEARYGAR